MALTRKPLRLWPGLAAAALLLVIRYAVPAIVPGSFGMAVIAGLAGTLAVALWWLFFSRAPWFERLGVPVLMSAAVAATSLLVHESIKGGMMGMLLSIYAAPVLSIGLVAWAAASRSLSRGLRGALLAVIIVLACGTFTLLRTDGITGDDGSQFAWRWTPTPEERLLAQQGNRPPGAAVSTPGVLPPAPVVAEAPGVSPATPPRNERSAPAPPDTAPASKTVAAPAAAPAADAEWPGFRGPGRDGVARGARIQTDWSQSPPAELWRRAVGPGWSSFAVLGDRVYTQEQRGGEEVVSCYRLTTGEPVWSHGDAVRFWESNGGAGPRATPALHNGRVYTMGATGLLNALDAGTGAVAWSRNAATDTGKKIPDWGIAGSPLVIDDQVIVAVAGQLVAYDARTGTERWAGEPGGGGYSSPHFVTIDGVPQVLLIRGSRTISVNPADGKLLWEHSWDPAVAITQPALAGDRDVLIGLGEAMGMGGLGVRRLALARGPSGWNVTERWTTRGLKPYFNDFVVHKGHAFGFDGSILASINLEDGTRKWKGGRYGHGQIVLLPDQDLLLVLSEEGGLALVSATADKFTELTRFPAIEGKTWNHPALVRDVLLVRNGEQMAAYRLPAATR